MAAEHLRSLATLAWLSPDATRPTAYAFTSTGKTSLSWARWWCCSRWEEERRLLAPRPPRLAVPEEAEEEAEESDSSDSSELPGAPRSEGFDLGSLRGRPGSFVFLQPGSLSDRGFVGDLVSKGSTSEVTVDSCATTESTVFLRLDFVALPGCDGFLSGARAPFLRCRVLPPSMLLRREEPLPFLAEEAEGVFTTSSPNPGISLFFLALLPSTSSESFPLFSSLTAVDGTSPSSATTTAPFSVFRLLLTAAAAASSFSASQAPTAAMLARRRGGRCREDDSQVLHDSSVFPPSSSVMISSFTADGDTAAAGCCCCCCLEEDGAEWNPPPPESPPL